MLLNTYCRLQIAEIKRQGEEKKQEFSKHLEKTSEEVQDFSERMLVSITCLDDLFMSGSRLADRGHDVEVLTQFDGMSTQLMQAEKDLSYEKPFMVKQSYLDKGVSNKQFADSKNIVLFACIVIWNTGFL